MNLKTTYMGLKLRTPLVVSASPLSESVDNIKRMEDAGAAAIVLPSLFEEQLTSDSQELHFHLTQGTYSFAEALTYFPVPTEEFTLGPDSYLDHIRKAKEALGKVEKAIAFKGRISDIADDLVQDLLGAIVCHPRHKLLCEAENQGVRKNLLLAVQIGQTWHEPAGEHQHPDDRGENKYPLHSAVLIRLCVLSTCSGAVPTSCASSWRAMRSRYSGSVE